MGFSEGYLIRVYVGVIRYRGRSEPDLLEADLPPFDQFFYVSLLLRKGGITGLELYDYYLVLLELYPVYRSPEKLEFLKVPS